MAEQPFGPPAIGGLLRMASQIHRDRVYERLIAAGFRDVTQSQFALLLWPGIDGMKPSDVAEVTGLSKQTVNGLLGEFQSARYLKRLPHPDDGRARIIRFTDRGWKLYRTAYAISHALEVEWAAGLGQRRFQALRSALEAMVERGLPIKD